MEIAGYISNKAEPIINIIVRGLRAQIEIEAIIDTGFNGCLCLPIEIAVQLGLELCAVEKYELADGDIKRVNVFMGSIIWFNKGERINIILTDSEQALIGTSLLQDKRLEIDFRSDKVTIS